MIHQKSPLGLGSSSAGAIWADDLSRFIVVKKDSKREAAINADEDKVLHCNAQV